MDDDDRAPTPTPAPALTDAAPAPHTTLDDVTGILTGAFAVSLGLHLLDLSLAVTGGTAGLSLLLGFATGWPFPVLFLAINVPFAVLAVIRKGWDFTIRTMLSIALVSGFAALNRELLQVSDIQPLYGTLAGNLLCGIGMLILFRHRSSLGGVQIVALVIQDATGVRAGWSQMVFDVSIVLLALLVVPWPNVLAGAAGAVVLNLVLALNHRPGRYLGA